jgi:DNA repair photolyase
MPRPIQNPPNPWAEREIEWDEEPPPAELEVFEEEAKSALSENDSPDVGFKWSLNPYRGCYHGCSYCYARSSHQYLGFGAGTDFDRKIVVKINAAEKLREAFERRAWKGEVIAFSGNTDCYQPLEASYRLTRKCLEVCLEYLNPVGIITKGAVIRRDAELLARLAREARCRVTMSIAFASDEDSRKMEPSASPPSRRFETMRILHEAGVPVGLGLAPVIPGLNDMQIPEILERAHAAGASHAFINLVRLSGETLPVFETRLAEAYPDRERKVRHAIQEMRGGKMNLTVFHDRMSGTGPRWRVIEQLFETHVKRLGMNQERPEEPTTFRRPVAQLSLF